MTLTPEQLTDARRHCGYPARGSTAAGNDGYRYFQADGQLEWRLLNLTPPEEAVVGTYLDTLAGMEAAIPAAAEALDTASAAGWTRNAGELAEREALFDGWRRRLCGFLGIPPGPFIAAGPDGRCVV